LGNLLHSAVTWFSYEFPFTHFIAMTMTSKRQAGFTLMELLIVLAIIVALFAILLPVIFEQQRKSYVRQANVTIKQLQGDLELYRADHRGMYPTNEQGLMALVFVPDVQMMPPQTAPVGSGYDPNTGFDPNFGGSGGVGPESLQQFPGGTIPMPGQSMPGQSGMIDPTTGLPMQGQSGMTDPITGLPMQGQSGMIDPMTGLPTQGQSGMIDPTTGLPMTGIDPMTGQAGGMRGAAWTQPFHNPNLYLRKIKRSDGGIDEKRLIDPWGNAYRYDNSRNAYGVNQYTGEARPAIWSVGDKGKDDDISGWVTNWDPAEAAQYHQEAMQRVQQQNPYGIPQGVGPESLQNNQFMDPMQQQMQFDPNNPQFGPGQTSMPTQQQMPINPNNQQFGPGQTGIPPQQQMPFNPNNTVPGQTVMPVMPPPPIPGQ
jgi:prepilin-type N-terminal cleavage/methylation domain-containing protein